MRHLEIRDRQKRPNRRLLIDCVDEMAVENRNLVDLVIEKLLSNELADRFCLMESDVVV